MLRQLRPSVVGVLGMTVAFGLAFPLVVTALAQVLFPWQANGSLIRRNGKVIGSTLIGQNFAGPGYFHPRPSAAGNGYDGTASGGTNLGPTSAKLINGIHQNAANSHGAQSNFDGIRDLAAAYRRENALPPDVPLPADAVTRSASGLDPHISPANADLQVARVARSRGLAPSQVRALVRLNTEGRQLGVLGEPRVNVLRLNLALDAIQHNPVLRQAPVRQRSNAEPALSTRRLGLAGRSAQRSRCALASLSHAANSSRRT